MVSSKVVSATPVKELLLASFLLLIIDIPWLLLQGSAYQSVVSSIQGSPLRLRAWAAIPVYLALGYLLLQQYSVLSAAIAGSCIYAVYDFTTLAIFDKYPLHIAVLDTLWGGILFGLAFTLLPYIS
jgi:uncharacterized membrane protein